MVTAVKPYTFNELSTILFEKFGGAKKRIDNIDEMRESVYETAEENDLVGCEAEEVWHQEQFMAREIAPLKDYFKTPSPSTLGQVKSAIAEPMEPGVSHFAINYIKDWLGELDRNEREEELYQRALTQERILATNDKEWERALATIAEAYGDSIAKAPSIDTTVYDGDPLLRYHSTFVIKEGTDSLLDMLIEGHKSFTDHMKDHLLSFQLRGPLSSIHVGVELQAVEHLEEKGLDGLTMFYENLIQHYHQKEDGVHIRTFSQTSQEIEHFQPGYVKRQNMRAFSENQEFENQLHNKGIKYDKIDEGLGLIDAGKGWAEYVHKLSEL